MEQPCDRLRIASGSSPRILSLLPCLLLLAWCAAPAAAASPSTLVLEPGTDAYRLAGSRLQILVDPGRARTLRQVTTPPLAGEFAPAGDGVNLGFTRAAVWLRFTLENRRQEGPATWILALDIPPMIHADLYWPDEAGALGCTRGGTSVPLSDKAIRYRGHAFRVQLPPGSTRTGYMRLSSEETLVVDLRVLTPRAFREKERSELHLFLLIAGIFVAVAFSNLLIYLFTRDLTYLYFVLFILSFAMFLASNFGLATLFLWPDSPAASRLASPLSSGLAQFWGLLFCRKFAETGTRLPRTDRFYRAAIVLAALTVPLTLVDSFAGNVAVGVLSLFVFSLAMIACVARLRSRFEPARLFIAAVAVAMVGGFLSWLMVFGFLGFNIVTFGLGPVALIVSIVLFIFSIGNRLFVFQSNYQRIFHGVNDPIYVYSPDTGSFPEVNRRACDCYGYSAAEWKTLSIEDILETADGSSPSREEIRQCIQRALSDEPQRLQAVNRRKNGQRFWGELNLIRADVCRRACLLVVTRDITDHKRLQHDLQSAAQTWKTTFDAMNDAVAVLDPNGVIVLCNRAMGTLMDRSPEEMVGHPCWEVVHGTSGPVQDCPHQRVKQTLRRESTSITLGRRQVEVAADPLLDREGVLTGCIHTLTDVTSRKKMEEELLRAQKMESVGVLAGGIAHDFNNILMVIWGNISLAKMSAPADAPIRACLEQAEIASKRARDLSQQLLTFARGGAPVKRPVALAKLCREAVGFALSGSSSTYLFEAEHSPWWAEVDEGQINQVFYNIALNAVQAMPGGGTFRVRGRTRDLDQESDLPLKPGRYLELLFQDEGVGIRPEEISRIFDPYFTTKHAGSGLGLAITYSILRAHGGHIRVRSTPGEGTTFQVLLPLMENPPGTAAAPDRKGEPVFGSGRVLLMDDEPMVLEVARNILTYLGYEVTVAAEGGEALDLYRQAMGARQPFDLVILDLTVPGGLGGAETIRKLREIDPGVRAIVSSGYFGNPVMADFRNHGFDAVIAKPYTVDTLGAVLRQVLQGAAPSARA